MLAEKPGRRALLACGTVAVALSLSLTAPSLSRAAPPEPTTDAGFTTLLDGSLSGGAASFDKWVMAGPGAFVPYGDGQGFMTTGGLGMLWYPKDFGDAVFRIDYRDVRTATGRLRLSALSVMLHRRARTTRRASSCAPRAAAGAMPQSGCRVR